MKPVMQTKFGDPEGNCFEASIASYLGIPLEDVPVMAPMRTDMNVFWATLLEWLQEHHGLCLVRAPSKGTWVPPGVYHLIGGLGPRGLRHAGVGKGGVLVHDPHPEGGGLLEDSYWFFVPSEGGE